MEFFKKNIVALLALAILAVILVPTIDSFIRGGSNWLDSMKKTDITLGTTTISAWVADTEEVRTRGFSGTKGISRDQGMLFVFPKSGTYGFWMNDMLFALDIIWLDESFEIVHIEEGIAPETFPKTFFPKRPARYVLEIQSGLSRELSIKIGDVLKVTLPE